MEFEWYIEKNEKTIAGFNEKEEAIKYLELCEDGTILVSRIWK